MNSGRIIERRGQVLTGFVSLVARAFSTLATRWWSTKGPFLRERVICYPLLFTARHDHGLCALVVAGAVAFGQVAPRIDRVTAFTSPTFTTTVRVVDRVHGGTTDGRTDAHPALDTGFTQLAQAVLFIGDFADGGAALDVDLADFARAHMHLGVDTFAGQQGGRGASRAGDLGTGTGLELDAVDGRTHRDVADRQGVAGAHRGSGVAHQGAAHFNATGGDDVGALAVGVAQQRDVRGAVRIVFDALNFGRDTVLVALEVHHAVVVLVTTALVTGGDVAVVVAARLLVLGFQQRSVGFAFVQMVTGDLHHATTAGRGRVDLDDSHDYAASPDRFSS